MEKYIKHGEDDEAVVHALTGCLSLIHPMVLKAAINLDLFEIIGNGAGISASAIAAKLPTRVSPEGVGILDSMLRFLTAHSFLTCSTRNLANGRTEKCYGLSSAGRCFVGDESGVSLAPFHALNSNPYTMEMWFNLESTVLEKGTIFERVYDKHAYEHAVSNSEFGNMFNDAMVAHSTIIMKKIIEIYDGFKGLSSLVDVGGGYGICLDMIISKYPLIRGVNFDLPQVIKSAPSYKGIEHVGGNMFHHVPQADAIFLKNILHNWNDEKCVTLLKNCHKALPNKGKLIVVECILPDIHQTDVHAKYVSQMDVIMLTTFGGKVRTRDELEELAMKASFSEFKMVCCVCGVWILEFLKLE